MKNKPRKVVIWGYPLHTHTHSYIHFGYYRAFKALGYDTYWFDNAPVSGLDLSDSLIITEHFATSFLPLSKSSTYFVHYLGNRGENHNKYLNDVGRLIDMRYNSNSWVDKNYDYHLDRSKVEKVSDGTYFEKGKDYDIAYTTWATDLFPNEIDLEWRFHPREKKINYIGTIGGGKGGLFDCLKAPPQYDTVPYIMPFYEECKKNDIEFLTNCPWISPMTPDNVVRAVMQSYLAPDFRHKAMLEWGYIPCRVMKNISYGQLGMTNSEEVFKFFEGEVIFNSDASQLFYDGRRRMQDYDFIKSSMMLVRDKHTYIGRANDILNIYNKK